MSENTSVLASVAARANSALAILQGARLNHQLTTPEQRAAALLQRPESTGGMDYIGFKSALKRWEDRSGNPLDPDAEWALDIYEGMAGFALLQSNSRVQQHMVRMLEVDMANAQMPANPPGFVVGSQLDGWKKVVDIPAVCNDDLATPVKLSMLGNPSFIALENLMSECRKHVIRTNDGDAIPVVKLGYREYANKTQGGRLTGAPMFTVVRFANRTAVYDAIRAAQTQLVAEQDGVPPHTAEGPSTPPATGTVRPDDHATHIQAHADASAQATRAAAAAAEAAHKAAAEEKARQEAAEAAAWTASKAQAQAQAEVLAHQQPATSWTPPVPPVGSVGAMPAAEVVHAQTPTPAEPPNKRGGKARPAPKF